MAVSAPSPITPLEPSMTTRAAAGRGGEARPCQRVGKVRAGGDVDDRHARRVVLSADGCRGGVAVLAVLPDDVRRDEAQLAAHVLAHDAGSAGDDDPLRRQALEFPEDDV